MIFTSTQTQCMKKVNWTKIASQKIPENSFWMSENNEQQVENLFTDLSEHFSLPPTKKIPKIVGTKPEIKLRVITTNNAQNLLILLRSRYKTASPEDVYKYILHCDDQMLTDNFIEVLLKCLPQPHSAMALLKLKEKNIELVDAEDFLASLCTIRDLLPRLRCIQFMIRFNDVKSYGLKSDIEAGIAACDEVIACKKFHEILKLILSVGNMLNSGSSIGQAHGFELSILPQLKEIKTNDNKRTLLQYLVQKIEKKSSELLNFGYELNNVHGAARLNLDNVKGLVEELATGLKMIQAELQNGERAQLSEDKFVAKMTPFALQCQAELELLTKITNKMDDSFKKVGVLFGFDVNKYPMQKCFADINSFKDMFGQEIPKTYQLAERRMKDQKENPGKLMMC